MGKDETDAKELPNSWVKSLDGHNFFMPKVDESIKALYVSMDESKKRTAMLRAKKEFLEHVFSSDFFRKSDEDLKMVGASSIDSLFSKFKMKKGLEKSQL